VWGFCPGRSVGGDGLRFLAGTTAGGLKQDSFVTEIIRGCIEKSMYLLTLLFYICYAPVQFRM